MPDQAIAAARIVEILIDALPVIQGFHATRDFIPVVMPVGVGADGEACNLDAAMAAVRNGVKSAHIIDGRQPGALLLQVLTSEGLGTLFHADEGTAFIENSRRYLDAVDLSSPR